MRGRARSGLAGPHQPGEAPKRVFCFWLIVWSEVAVHRRTGFAPERLLHIANVQHADPAVCNAVSLARTFRVTTTVGVEAR